MHVVRQRCNSQVQLQECQEQQQDVREALDVTGTPASCTTITCLWVNAAAAAAAAAAAGCCAAGCDGPA
jgi:hypothetical protein